MISQALFLLLISAAAVAAGETVAYEPTDLFLLNCGASNSPGPTGRNWTAEDRKLLASNSANASFTSKATMQDPSVTSVPYITARIFRSEFTYSFPVSRGWKFVRLHFYPTRYGSDLDAATSFFSVTANGFSLLRNFSASLTVMASKSKFLIREFVVPVLNGDQSLNLTFTPAQNSLAFVNGVEIVSMPDGLYTNGGFQRIKNVDSSVDFEINNTTAFETVYRLNVGGLGVADVNDSGMFRQWEDDNDAFLGNGGQMPYLEGLRINYTKSTPAYVAPEAVYTTYRTMGNAQNPRLNSKFNLTWIFTVDSGFNYLVRLHFCEAMQEVTKPGQRVFTIFIGNRTAVPDADVIQWSGGRYIPVFRDFVTTMVPEDGSGYGKRSLRLDLHPYVELNPTYYDALLNGVEILKLSDPTTRNLAGPNPEPTTSPEPNRGTPEKPNRKKKSHVMVITLVVVGCALGLTIMVLAALVGRQRKKAKDYGTSTTSKPKKSSSDPISYNTTSTDNTKMTSSLPSNLCRRFSLAEIRIATNDFDDKLKIGVGGFGTVYKGRIDGGSTLVAIKRLGLSSGQGAHEFETELVMLSKLRHVHLVSLIGYCDDQDEMILVYEYMPLGTLRDHLYKNNDSNPPLSWKQRLDICIGAARGLQYLHTGTKYPIIHRDIKSTNILLDDNYVAKVSDFGLSRIGPTSASQTHVSTAIKGSFGYLDPEYYRRQHLTEKSDVYSFGVVLFEVLCARAVNVPWLHKDQGNLTRWAKLNYSRGTVDVIVDPNLANDITSTSLGKFCEIAMKCIQDRAAERPTMNDVVWALEFALQLHETAKKNNNVDDMDLIEVDRGWLNSRQGEMGTTDEDEDMFSRSTAANVSLSTSTEERLLKHDGDGSDSGDVFSEIKKAKGR